MIESTAIYWIGTQAVDQCWPLKQIRDDGNRRTAIEPFLEDLANVKTRVLVLDAFFDDELGLQPLWDILDLTPASCSIRILSRQPRPSFNTQSPLGSRIHWKERMMPWLHDRFAILDDIMWHFGSTVGGAYRGFSAATRGWPARDLAYVFEDEWQRG